MENKNGTKKNNHPNYDGCGCFVTETTTKGTHYVCNATRYIPHDTKAIIFYLKNRGRKNRRAHWDVDVNGDFKPVVIKDDLEK